ncbi:MAG: hypothetical protein JRH03_01495 [Deltaproteobacteria bacterium]|nr:hypothetical protein [Deltaproteobacteria bacterium]
MLSPLEILRVAYTFPLPLEAVLLDMTIKTQTKELKGIVIEKKEAEERYEEAIYKWNIKGIQRCHLKDRKMS